jgi:hypothetical protein
MKNGKIIAVVLAVVALGVGFFGGMQYQKSKTPAVPQGFIARGGNGGGERIAQFRPVTGQIISQDSSSITVKLQDGSSKIVLLPSTVVVSETTASSVSGLKVGDNVRVLGTTNPDGSVSATDVQINPAGPMGEQSGRTPGPTPQPTTQGQQNTQNY